MSRNLKREKSSKISGALHAFGSLLVLIIFCTSLCRCGSKSSGENMELRLISQFDSASILVQKGDFNRALPIYYDIASFYSNSLTFNGKEICAAALNNAGYIEFFEMGRDSLAFANLLKALEIGEKIKSEKVLSHIYLNISSVRNSYTSTPVLRDLDMKAFSYAMNVKKWETLSIIYINSVYTAFFSQLELQHVDEMTRIFRQLNGVDSIPIGKYAKGMMKAYETFRGNDMLGAVNLLRESAKNLDDIIDGSLYRVNNYYLQAQLHDLNSMKDSALNDVRNGIAYAEKSDMPNLTTNGYFYLFQLFNAMAIPDSANFYKLKYLEIIQNYKSASNLNVINEMQRNYEQNSHESQLKSVAVEKQEWVGISVVVGAVLIIVCIFLIFLIKHNRRLKLHNARLYSAWKEKQSAENDDVIVPQPAALLKQNENCSEAKESQAEDDWTKEISDKIKDVFESDEIFKPEFSLSTLSALLNVKERYLSSVLSSCYGRSLPALVAEARIKEACRRLDNWDKYSHLTLFGLAQELGFKSGSVFSTTFKKITGLSPKAYLQQASK